MNALVRVGGCTGSFVSPEGLIITNHHCAFGAVAAASSVENDYISNGYLARENKSKKLHKDYLYVLRLVTKMFLQS